MKPLLVLFTMLIMVIMAPVSLFQIDASNKEIGSIVPSAFYGIKPHFSDIAMPKRLPPIGFQSFKQARDEFAQKLAECDGYSIAGFVNLDNAIKGSANDTTGDHDGEAVVLSVGW